MAKPKSRQTEELFISSPAPAALPTTLSDRAKRILADNGPISPEDWFILTQVHLICLFRRAERAKQSSRKAKFCKYISRRGEKYISQKKEEGLENSFTPQDFLNLNQWVVSQDLAGERELENLIKRVKERKKLAKRAAKKLKTKTRAK